MVLPQPEDQHPEAAETEDEHVEREHGVAARHHDQSQKNNEKDDDTGSDPHRSIAVSETIRVL